VKKEGEMLTNEEARLGRIEMDIKHLQEMVADLCGVPVAVLFSRHFPSGKQTRLDDYGTDE
tara:strand:+ start:722 stop:904 length:183 start_codon:yes stop_codon:yes gene_type:complete